MNEDGCHLFITKRDFMSVEHNVKRFKNLTIALKELEPFIRNGEHLQTGRGFKSFGDARSRELLGNWLLCVVANYFSAPERFIFCSDPTGGDGIIYDTETKETWLTEHVMVPTIPGAIAAQDIEQEILGMIMHKYQRGQEYAAGKTLVVFLNRKGSPWKPNVVARKLPAPLLFEAVWVVGLQIVQNDEYFYNITRLDLREGNAPAWRVHIAQDFLSYKVEVVQ